MSDMETNGAPPESTTPAPSAPLSPGARLAAGREEHGWTVEQVASHLKLAPRQVVALERDDYAALPGMPIVRGFVRSYAKLLKIDPAPLLTRLGGETVLANEPLTPKESLSTPFSEARLPSMGDKPTISSKWVVGVLILLLIVAALWALQAGSGLFGTGPEESVPVEQTQVVPPADSVLVPVAPPIETLPAEEPPEVAQPAVPADGPAVVAPASETKPADAALAPATPAASPAPAAPAADAPATSSSSANALNLTVREESWIEIRREGSGRTLVARLAQPGENISVEIGEPVVLVVGNAAGVDATLRGEPVELSASTRTNVARVTLK